MTGLSTYVTALDQTWSGLADVCAALSPAEWDLPTDLPGWSVKDNVSHVIGVERILIGESQPSHDLPESLPHVRNDFGRYMEVHVDLRRALPGPSVLAELREVTARRMETLKAYTDADLDTDVRGVFGSPSKLKHLLGIRVFDCWTHEQDVRRAVGRPGGLTTEAALLSRRRLLLALTGLASSVPAADTRTLVVETTGAVESVATLRFGSSYVDGDSADADVRMVVDFETFLRLGTGRLAYEPGMLALSGDVALGEQVARAMAITP